ECVRAVMGCRGSEVQILSCRPKILEEPACYGWFFYACFMNGEATGNNWGKTPTQNIDFTVKFQLFTSLGSHQTPRSWHH
ncbi:hypothetical protein, partial [Citrobacter freundii]|uniref:hypothetical protein n=1 Tax=Citrobacter freundii TaxID=546 RepID=UPI001A954E9B